MISIGTGGSLTTGDGQQLERVPDVFPVYGPVTQIVNTAKKTKGLKRKHRIRARRASQGEGK